MYEIKKVSLASRNECRTINFTRTTKVPALDCSEIVSSIFDSTERRQERTANGPRHVPSVLMKGSFLTERVKTEAKATRVKNNT
jgi:hypothetical protein